MLHAPNSDDTSCLEQLLHETYGRQNNDLVVLAGDWNTVLDNKLDKLGGLPAHSNRKRQTLLNTAMNELGLHDPFRLQNPNLCLYTHVNKRCKTQTRLDFFLVDNNVVNFPVCTSTISHGFRSDHSYVQLKLQGNKMEHGRGYWKLNNTLLEIPEFVESTKNIINETINDNFDSWGGLWDVIKFKVKDFGIRYGKENKKKKCQQKIELDSKIKQLRSEINQNSTPGNEENLNQLYEQLHQAEQQLNNIICTEIQGIITRSRIQWAEEGERSTKYFLGLEKSAQKKKSFTKLVTESGEILTSQNEISKHVVTFYQSLFSSRHPTVEKLRIISMTAA